MAQRQDIIQVLSRYRIASIAQLAALLGTSVQMARRWVRESEDLRAIPGTGGRGRPQQWVSLKTYNGNAVHDWNVTEFAVALTNFCQKSPDWSFSARSNVAFEKLLPDLCLPINRRSPARSLLFFLEMDCGTEPLCRSGDGTDVRTKLARYVELRATGRYLAAWGDSQPQSRGFRVLLLALTEKRAQALCREARTLPGDFVWVSSWERIREKGVNGEIWQRGGRDEKPESIFGSLQLQRAHPSSR